MTIGNEQWTMMVSLRDDFKKLVRKSEKTSRFTIIILFIPGWDSRLSKKWCHPEEVDHTGVVTEGNTLE